MAESGELAFQTGERIQQVPDLRKVPPSVQALSVVEAGEPDADGGIPLGIRVFFTPPEWWGQLRFDVWAKDSAEEGFVHIGMVMGSGARLSHPFLMIGRTYTVAVCSVSVSGASTAPDGSPTASVTMTGAADVIPDDVTGFNVSVDGPFVRFVWNAHPNPSRNVRYFRIQSGAAWVGGVLVGLVAPAGAVAVAFPRAQAPGNVFAIKAVTGTGRESSGATLAYLTAAENTCANSERTVVPREVTIATGAASAVVETICPYDVAPIVTFLGTGGLSGWVDPISFAQLPDGRWSYTLFVDDIAAAPGEPVYLHESGTPEPTVPEDAPPALSWAPEYPDLAPPRPSRVYAMPAVFQGPLVTPAAPAAPDLSWQPDYPDWLRPKQRTAYLGPWRGERRSTP